VDPDLILSLFASVNRKGAFVRVFRLVAMVVLDTYKYPYGTYVLEGFVFPGEDLTSSPP